MALLLTVTQGPDQGKSLTLESGRTYRVGCDSADDFVLTDPMVLKGHCSLEVGDESVILRNHTASAGTYIGEKKIAQARIPGRMTFRIGDSALTLRPAPAATPAPSQPQTDSGVPATAKPRGGANDPLVGKIIGGYKLLEVIGRGGMGVVYKAVQLSLQREVALKVLARKLSTDKNFRDLFINEARAAAQLVHPNIVQVYDAGNEGDVTYFSMEYIGQGSVEEILERDKKIAWPEAILMVLEAAHGLEYAEKKGIVHRDIKPDNLMLNDDGRIKIADLGLAKRGEGGPDQGIIGTPHFIPPEQALGKEVDTRADIYSLGATFFRMITGRTVFTGKTAKEIVLKHIKEPPPAASSYEKDVPDELDGVIAKMLAKDPEQRFASASELISALETVCAHHGIKGSIIKKGVSKAVLVPLFLLLIGAGYAVYHFATQEREVFEDTSKLSALQEQQRIEQEQARERQEAQAREIRKQGVQASWTALDAAYWREGGDRGVESHRDEADGRENEREQKWRDWADRFEDFSNKEELKEFEDELGLAKKAEDKAAEIRKTLDEVKQTARDKQETLAAAVAAIEKFNKEQRGLIDAFIRELKYSDAYELADRLSREKNKDTFQEILSQKWINPISKKPTPFENVERLVNAVKSAREGFRRRKDELPDAAKATWEAIRDKTVDAQALAAATDEDLENSIAALQPVVDNFGAAQNEIRDARDAARIRMQALEGELERRFRAREASDRQSVKDALRQQRSLDPDVVPNNVMNANFVQARSAWQRLLDTGAVKTARYEAFVRERIEALRYIEWLFTQFQNDVKVTDSAGRGDPAPLKSLKSEFKVEDRTFSFNFDKPDQEDPTRFWLNKSFRGDDNLLFSTMGMDWVYECAFREPESAPGELRWVDPTPVIRFSVALFCFETMQFDEAAEQFKLLEGDETYGKIASFFGTRALEEAKARAAYVGLLREFRAATTSAQVQAVQAQLKKFESDFAGTLFHLDVMETSGTIEKDIYPDVGAEDTKIPVLPIAPTHEPK